MQIFAAATRAMSTGGAPPGLEKPPEKMAKPEMEKGTAQAATGEGHGASESSKPVAQCVSPTQPWSPPPAKGVPAAVSKSIDRAARNFEGDIRKWTKNQDLVMSEHEAVAAMEKAKSQGRTKYPPGNRQCKSPCELATLENKLDLCQNADAIFVVNLPEGLTRREALERIHFASALLSEQVHLQSHQEACEVAEQKVTKEAFLARCQAYCERHDMDGLASRTRSPPPQVRPRSAVSLRPSTARSSSAPEGSALSNRECGKSRKTVSAAPTRSSSKRGRM